MRVRYLIMLGVLGASLVTCGPAISVRTSVSPDAHLGRLRTFTVLPVPPRRKAEDRSSLDPMIFNSSINRALRDAIRENFENRGYTPDERHPDFAIAYYASARERLDVTMWNYGYPWRPLWWRGWGRSGVTTVYTEGTVIVDVLDGQTRELLWRGKGVSAVSNNPRIFREDLRETVALIVRRFPAARLLVRAD